MKWMKVVRCWEINNIRWHFNRPSVHIIFCKEINVETFDTIMFDLHDFDYNVNITEIRL